jgi:hypothetical protein
VGTSGSLRVCIGVAPISVNSLSAKTNCVMERELRIQTEKRIHKTTELFRGPLLERAIQIESQIDIYIASVFTDSLDKEDEFICLILAGMGMNTKLKIFGYLVNKYSNEYKESNPSFYDDLCLMNSRRNMIAHHPAAFDDLSLETFLLFNKFTLAKAKYEKQSIPDFEIFERQLISEDDINGLLQMMDRYIVELRNLNGLGYDSAPDDKQGQVPV